MCYLFNIDVSGGDSASILDAIRRCMDVSSHLCIADKNTSKKNGPLTWLEAFYLATLGGAKGTFFLQFNILSVVKNNFF